MKPIPKTVFSILRHLHIALSLSVILFVLVGSASGMTETARAMADRPEMSSEAAILMDAGTGGVIYEKNSREPLYPASITKIVTALVAIEAGNLDDIVQVSKNARNVEGTRVYLVEGEKVTLRKLIQGMLLNSGNDAAVAVAEHIDGSVQAFAERMNRFMQSIGATDSHFENPHGLHAEHHVTTALDMAKVMRYARSNKTFMEISGTKEMDWKGEGWETHLYNHHLLIRQDKRVKAGKNGFTDQAGYTLVTYATDQGKEFIAVVLKAPSKQKAYEDTLKLLDTGFENTDSDTIQAPKKYEKPDGTSYLLNKPVSFRFLKDTSWREEIKDDGTLVIEGDYGPLAQQPLLEVKRQKPAEVQTRSSTPTEEQLYIQPIILYGIIGMAALLIAGLRYVLHRTK